MQFSVWPGIAQPWDDILEVARHAEITGWDRIYIADHFMPNAEPDSEDIDGPMLECWGVVAALAAAVPRLGIGTLVCGNTYRHPAVLANQAATADAISGGRVILGLGAGWQINEHQRYGINLFGTKDRMDRFEEACEIVRSLIDNPRTTFDGKHYMLTNAPMEPKPTGAMPLLVGGKGEKRTLRIAARFAQEWNAWTTPEVFTRLSGVLDGHCEDLDRDPATIHRSTQALLFLSDDQSFLAKRRRGNIPMPTLIGNPEQLTEAVAAYRDAGVDELIIPDFTLGTSNQRQELLDRFINEVAVNFRE